MLKRFVMWLLPIIDKNSFHKRRDVNAERSIAFRGEILRPVFFDVFDLAYYA